MTDQILFCILHSAGGRNGRASPKQMYQSKLRDSPCMRHLSNRADQLQPGNAFGCSLSDARTRLHGLSLERDAFGVRLGPRGLELFVSLATPSVTVRHIGDEKASCRKGAFAQSLTALNSRSERHTCGGCACVVCVITRRITLKGARGVCEDGHAVVQPRIEQSASVETFSERTDIVCRWRP